jgi:signal peptidase II
MKITRLGWTAYAIAPTTVVLDQISKPGSCTAWDLPNKATVRLPGPLYLTMVLEPA